MSLISEALKRTQQHSGTRPLQAPALRKPIGTSTSPYREHRVLIIVVVTVFVLGGAALLALWRMYSMLAANAKRVEQVTIAAPSQPEAEKEPLKIPEAITPPPIPDEVKAAVRAADLELPRPTPSLLPPSPPAPPRPPPPPKELPKLTLQGVTIHGGLREALINGQVVRVGDEVEGAKVIAIDQMKVKLRFDGREITLSLY